jgi:hypothetical protein
MYRQRVKRHTEKVGQIQIRNLPMESGGGYLIKLSIPRNKQPVD